MIGSRVQVLRQAVHLAGACEGGSLQPQGRRCTPEAYIRRIRAALDGPGYLDRGYWRACVRVRTGHVLLGDLKAIGLGYRVEMRYREEEVLVESRRDRWPEYFRLIDRYGLDVPPWRWGRGDGIAVVLNQASESVR